MIPERRTGSVDLLLVDGSGAPLADVPVEVRLRRHAFGFGNIGFDLLRTVGGPDPDGAESVEAFGGVAEVDPARFEAQWLRLFDTATLPFYWGRYEPVRGRTDETRLRRTAKWLTARDVVVKGHPLVWHTVQPSWLLGLPDSEVESLLRERVRTLVGGFAGTINLWGFVRADGSEKPAYAALDRLITDGWGFWPALMRTDATGRLPVRGPRGTYALTAAGREAGFAVGAEPRTEPVVVGGP